MPTPNVKRDRLDLYVLERQVGGIEPGELLQPHVPRLIPWQGLCWIGVAVVGAILAMWR